MTASVSTRGAARPGYETWASISIGDLMARLGAQPRDDGLASVVIAASPRELRVTSVGDPLPADVYSVTACTPRAELRWLRTGADSGRGVIIEERGDDTDERAWLAPLDDEELLWGHVRGLDGARASVGGGRVKRFWVPAPLGCVEGDELALRVRRYRAIDEYGNVHIADVRRLGVVRSGGRADG